MGDGCNVPKAFSVVYSGDTLCTTRAEDTYSIGCNPDAPESIRTACVEMFQAAISAKSNTVRDGIAFRVKFNFNSSTPTEVECVKYGAGKMPSGLNLYDNVACKALLKNGEFYDIYVADTGGSPINSLQTTSRTVERDTEIPRLESLKYFTDSSLTTEVASGVWSSKPVIAVAVCSDSPRGESLACSCAPSVSQSTTDSSTWSLGTLHGTVEIGADLLRYTRTIAENLVGNQTIGVVDTAGNVSPTQTFTLSLDTKSPIVAVTESAISGATRTLTLTATDTDSRIWKNRTAPTGAQPNTNGIIYRMGPKENAETLAFDAECSVTPATSNFANVLESATLQTSATVSIPSVNTTTTIVAYCVRDNAGNTTRGIYPVLTDSCFSATNMTKVPTFDDYRSLTSTRLTSAPTLNQKYGYSFSENTTNAACFR